MDEFESGSPDDRFGGKGPIQLVNTYNLAYFRNSMAYKKRYCNPHYLSPEIIEGLREGDNDLYVAGDLWSIGTILYVLLHG